MDKFIFIAPQQSLLSVNQVAETLQLASMDLDFPLDLIHCHVVVVEA
jgi:hypothetical protein